MKPISLFAYLLLIAAFLFGNVAISFWQINGVSSVALTHSQVISDNQNNTNSDISHSSEHDCCPDKMPPCLSWFSSHCDCSHTGYSAVLIKPLVVPFIPNNLVVLSKNTEHISPLLTKIIRPPISI